MKITIWVLMHAWTTQDGSNEEILKEVFYTEEDAAAKADELWNMQGTDYVISQKLEIAV